MTGIGFLLNLTISGKRAALPRTLCANVPMSPPKTKTRAGAGFTFATADERRN